MARIDHLTAIILTRGPLREFDRRLVIYSRELGKLSLIAKGTLRITSKLAGSLEPLVEAQIDVARGRSNRVIGSVLLAPWTGLRASLQSLAAGNFVAQVIDELVDIESPDPVLYDELRNCFKALDQGASVEIGPNVRRLIWRLIDRLGFKPRLDHCTRCGNQLEAGLLYSPMLGGTICAKCASAVDDVINFDRGIIKVLDGLLGENSVEAIPADDVLDRAVAQFIEATLLTHIGKRLPADRFWRSINRL